MDINELLNQIIFKYHLDCPYPHYRNMYGAEKIIKNIIRNIICNQKKAIFVGDDKIGNSFVRNMTMDYANIHFLYYKRNNMDLHQLEKIDWNEYEEIYLISFYEAEYVKRYFRLHHISYEWIYDVFEREDLFLQKEFFALGKGNMLALLDPKKEQLMSSPYIGAVQCELYCQQSEYHSADNFQTKRIALEKCLFLSLYMKNFVAAKEYAMLLMNEDERYRCMWNEVQNLLEEIRKTIKNKKQDIIWHWLDAIPYGEEFDMPYLKGAMQKSVVFENAFTNIAYTSPTLRAMFTGKKDIDDGGYHIDHITQDNSFVVRFLKERGYDIKVISGHFSYNVEGGAARTTADWLLPASVQYWDMISGMILQEQKTLWIVQAIDAHVPYLSRWLNDDNYRNRNERYRLAKQGLDEQLAFYDQMISDETTRIYMSDHGKDTIDKYHALFNIYHKSLKPRKIKELFSYLDFGTVLKQLIMNESINEKEFARDYVEIGNMDCYNRDNIEKLFRNKEPLKLGYFGHKGIVDNEYIYMHYTTGKEFLYKRDETVLVEPILYFDGGSDICNFELLPKYRKLAGEYPKEIIEDEKFRYSKYLHRIYHNIRSHSDMPKRIEIINRAVEAYPDNSIGIRLGGVTSAMLYQILSKENRKKIWGFIDNDPQCLCSKLQMPVLPVDQIEKVETFGVKAILLPSYVYLKMLREEAKTWPATIEVLDIYDHLEENGIECRGEFYKISGTDEDYDVGFPFDS